MAAQQLPGEETEARTAAPGIATTQLVGSAWKRKRSRSVRMTALASKRWDRGDAQTSSSATDQLSTAPGPSSVATAAPPNDAADNPLPAQHDDDSSCSDVSIANAAAS